MISLTYIKLVMSRKVIDAEKWNKAVDNIVPALRQLDFDHDGTVTVKELLRFVKQVVLAALA